MPKPHNHGTLVQVRLDLGIHEAIAYIQMAAIKSGIRPGVCTKAWVISEAVRLLEQRVAKAGDVLEWKANTGGTGG